MKGVENRSAALWDKILSDQDSARKAEGRYFYQLALKRIKRDETVCDAGCGYAFYLHDLIKKCGPTGSFIGIDFSAVALSKSQALAEGYPNARLLLADLINIPLPDEAVDRVFCAETIPYLLGDAEMVLKELGRISKNEVIFSLHTRGTYAIKGTPTEFQGNIVIEHKPGAKPPRRVFERQEIPRLVEAMGPFRVALIKPFRWADLMDFSSAGEDWPWFLPPQETIALYYVVAKKIPAPYLKRSIQ
jgi:SAM-dependent methyltransferase